MSVLQRIVSRRTQLSESGRQIGDWVLANAAQAAAMTSQDLAAWANVSQSSIVKFTQRLGFKGYSEFKLALTEELGRKQVMVNQPLHSNILADDPVAVIAQKLVQTKTEAMFHTTNALRLDEFSEAISWIQQAVRVQIIGIGGSALVAKDLAFKLLKLGITALTEQDSHVQIATARTLNSQDVLIAISFSGEKREILIAAQAAKQQGAKVIALTTPNKNRLREIADLALDTIADETQHRSSAIASRTAQNVLTDLIFLTLTQQRETSARQLIDDISSDIRQMR